MDLSVYSYLNGRHMVWSAGPASEKRRRGEESYYRYGTDYTELGNCSRVLHWGPFLCVSSPLSYFLDTHSLANKRGS